MGFFSNLLADIALVIAKGSSTCTLFWFYDEPELPDSLL